MRCVRRHQDLEILKLTALLSCCPRAAASGSPVMRWYLLRHLRLSSRQASVLPGCRSPISFDLSYSRSIRMDSGAGVGPSSTQLRAQGRQSAQLRGLACERGVLHRADGSARWQQDSSSVMAAVYGPRQAQMMKENAEHAVVEVVFKPRTGFPEAKDKDYEGIIRKVLEGVIPLGMHPRTSIMVVIQVLQDDGSLLSCAINAACAALIDAGIPMTTLFASVTCAILPGSSLMLDPCSKEEQGASALVSITHPFHFDLKEAGKEGSGKPVPVVGSDILACHTRGSFSMDQYLDAVSICHKSSEQVAEFSRIVLQRG